jgi:flavin reductase (DIM6/NTAB) family NADH-FMN oxidoreductase RutF
MHFYEPAKGHGLPHDPFNAIVGPRPIGWIGTRSAQGRFNLAPYSFFNAFNYTPPIIGFSSLLVKDTLRNIRETGVFTWNLVTESLADAMNSSSAAVGPETDEFALAGVSAETGALTGAPMVSASPVRFECRLTQELQLRDLQNAPITTWMVFGEVVGVYIDEALLKDGLYQTAQAKPVVRAGGPADYFTIGPEQLFKMRRPK